MRIGHCASCERDFVQFLSFSGIDKRIAEPPVTGVITVDFVPALVDGEARDAISTGGLRIFSGCMRTSSAATLDI